MLLCTSCRAREKLPQVAEAVQGLSRDSRTQMSWFWKTYPSGIDALIHTAHEVLIWWFFPCASAATHVWGMKAVFTVRCTCHAAGKLPGKWSEFTGSSGCLFLGSTDGALGQNAVSHGDPLIPQWLLTFTTASVTHCDHPDSWVSVLISRGHYYI